MYLTNEKKEKQTLGGSATGSPNLGQEAEIVGIIESANIKTHPKRKRQ